MTRSKRKYILHFDTNIIIQWRQLASACINRKWQSPDEIIVFPRCERSFQNQRGKIYKELRFIHYIYFNVSRLKFIFIA